MISPENCYTVMAHIKQLMAETEAITVGETDNEILIRASELLAEHRRMLVEWNGS